MYLVVQKKSNLIKFVLFSLYYRFWIRCFKNVKFNFINVRDLAQAVKLIILKLNISKIKYTLYLMIVINLKFMKIIKIFIKEKYLKS